MTDNVLLSHKTQEYVIMASNGQVLEVGFTSQKKAFARIREYKKAHPGERFHIKGVDKGTYGGR